MVYIFNGTNAINQAKIISKDIEHGVFKQLCIVMIAFTLSFLVFSGYRLTQLAHKMTL
jgi:hypothetical protein